MANNRVRVNWNSPGLGQYEIGTEVARFYENGLEYVVVRPDRGIVCHISGEESYWSFVSARACMVTALNENGVTHTTDNDNDEIHLSHMINGEETKITISGHDAKNIVIAAAHDRIWAIRVFRALTQKGLLVSKDCVQYLMTNF